MNEQEPVLEASNLNKSYSDGPRHITVLQDINLRVAAQECVAIMGASGSGKSTLLHCLGGLDKPDTGTVKCSNIEFSKLPDKQRAQFRNKHIGYVFQFHHLLAEFTALENTMMPLLLQGIKKSKAKCQAEQCLSQVNLQHRFEHKPGELSGGERQRVAIARAIVTEPSCVLADEPTGNLDTATAMQVYETLLNVRSQHNIAFIFVTHDHKLNQLVDRTLSLNDGILV